MTPGNRPKIKKKENFLDFCRRRSTSNTNLSIFLPFLLENYQCYLKLASADLNICIMSCRLHIIKIHVIWVSIIWYLRGIPWNEPSAPGLMSDRFDSNIISCLSPFRLVCPHLTLLLGNFPSEIKSLKIILRQKQELDVWMRALELDVVLIGLWVDEEISRAQAC